jgi:hypothetical protein
VSAIASIAILYPVTDHVIGFCYWIYSQW